MKKIICILVGLISFSSFAQTTDSRLRIKDFEVVSDTITIDSISISPYNFKVLDSAKQLIDSTLYSVNFAKAQLYINKPKFKRITVQYTALPEFLTKTYYKFDESLIVPQATDLSRLYSVQKSTINKNFLPFDGLQTSGSILRGFTVGNNQNAVVNSNFDLQISGNISKDVQVRASITDSNVPLQENGFSQRLDEFDRVFIELFSKNWKISAGDINLFNTTNQFLRFNKKVAGVQVDVMTESEENDTHFFASGALVRGQFARNSFTGEEGNQGPYKITGTNTEEFTLLISGSETVYVNGAPLTRGENNDYIVDYNTAEITFMPTFPITGSMRVVVEYQYADRNYTRFVTYNGAEYKNDKLKLGVTFYNENDVKNQPLQQDLTTSQKVILSQAGDNEGLMVAPSAYNAAFEENKILYKKELIGSEEVYVFSSNPDDELFRVTFTYVGEGQGNYVIQTTIASGRIFEYVAPVSDIKQGAYEPIVQLTPPNRLMIGVLNADYTPTEKTAISSELAYSSNDVNLFSSIDDTDNEGFAGKFKWNQILVDRNWKFATGVNYELIHKNFRTIERYRNVEFSRDWDLLNTEGNQSYLSTNLSLSNTTKGIVSYVFENLNYSENFNGIRHNLLTNLKLNRTKINVNSSLLSNNTNAYKTDFFRWYSHGKHHFSKSWIGAELNAESNKRYDKSTSELEDISHKLVEYEAFFGVGDTAKVYAEFGFNYQVTDSVQVQRLQKVNAAKTYFMRSKLIQNEASNLSLFVNYRTIDHTNFDDEESLNSRLLYRQQFFNNGVSLQTAYETNSGVLPQQEFNYVEVDAGLGYFTWNDYNNNGIQELDEFEVAQFQDEANYVRVLLPTINYIKTNQNKFSQSFTLNATGWSDKKGFKKFLSHFVNQSFIVIDGKVKRENSSFNLNPFAVNDALALNQSFKNSLFFNRGKQFFSTTYTFINTDNKNAYSINNQNNKLKSHQLLFNHRIKQWWLLDVKTSFSENKSTSDVFTSRNYTIQSKEFNPKISYLYSTNSRFEMLYHLKDKKNIIGDEEALFINTLGVNFIHTTGKNFSVNSSLNLVFNKFTGETNSAVGYQLLEGLRPGTNYTWNVSFQKRINSYLDVTFNYLGRKSESVKAIHTGSLQLRASF